MACGMRGRSWKDTDNVSSASEVVKLGVEYLVQCVALNGVVYYRLKPN